MGLRMYRVEYGFMAGRVCAFAVESESILYNNSKKETHLFVFL